jgi:diguanylate cyclase (GGDEF)-like protein
MIERFQYQLDHRTGTLVAAAAQVARNWKTISEIALATTGLLFLFVLYFVFRQRVLKPVVRLSDVVTRLAAQDYEVAPLNLSHIDEIGDMAQAIAIFRENGLARQQLEIERDADRALRDLLSRMTQRMQGCDSLEDLEAIVGRFIPEIAPDLAGRLYLTESANVLTETCNWLAPCHSKPEFAPSACWALRRSLPHRPAGGAVDVPCEHLDMRGDEIVDTLCLPLTAQGEVFGLLYFEPRVTEQLSATPAIYLTMLAENVGLALANIRLRDQLRAMAMTDALTGLANRRALNVALERRQHADLGDGQAVSCLMVDVDHFKRFNDHFGHDAGDAVLREVGAVLQNVVREGDSAYRYGGEEFVIFLPVGLAEARSRADTIRSRIAELRVNHNGVALGPILASVGVASAPLHCEASRIFAEADAALLQAKRQGRDRVIVAGTCKSRSAA